MADLYKKMPQDFLEDPVEVIKRNIWPLAMTVVSHEREPRELGYVARYAKVFNDLARRVRREPERFRAEQVRDLGRAIVEVKVSVTPP